MSDRSAEAQGPPAITAITLCTGRRPEWFAAAVASRTMVSEEDGYVPHRSCVTVSLVDRSVDGSARPRERASQGQSAAREAPTRCRAAAPP